MNALLFRFLAVAALLILCVGIAPAAEMKEELDCAANTKLIDSHFARYCNGYPMARGIIREVRGIRFRLPGAQKEAAQTAGLYSLFQMAGDFEFAVSYEIINMPTPTAGYGVSCGIAAETKDEKIEISLSRGQHKMQGMGYEVTKRTIGEDGKRQWDGVGQFGSLAKSGRMVLKREKDELICLASENLKDEPKELTRVPFSNVTVRTVRFYADTGGSPTPVEVRFSNIVARAEELPGGIAKRDQPGGSWWLWLFGIMLVGALGYAIYRRRHQDDDEEEKPKPKKVVRRPVTSTAVTAKRPLGKMR